MANPAMTTPAANPVSARTLGLRCHGATVSSAVHTITTATPASRTLGRLGSLVRPKPPPEQPLTPHQLRVIKTAAKKVAPRASGTAHSR